MSADQLLNLPWGIQISLASGYAAYVLAHAGIRSRHTALDVAFTTLAFGLIATGVLAAMTDRNAFAAGSAAFAAALVSGFIWRKWGRSIYMHFMRWSDLSWSNDDQSALETLCANSTHRLSQIAVLLDDGTWLRCDDASKFADAPFGPCQIGPAGDVALYLTHEEKPGDVEKELKTVRHEQYGARLTYVPAARVKRINLRHLEREPSVVSGRWRR